LAFALVPTAVAQAPAVPAAAAAATPAAAADPLALVAAAERQLARKDIEDAVLGLWQALDALAAQPASTVRDAAAMSARFLLQQHDPREANRRKAFAAVAKQQVDLRDGVPVEEVARHGERTRRRRRALRPRRRRQGTRRDRGGAAEGQAADRQGGGRAAEAAGRTLAAAEGAGGVRLRLVE
jgi:hypothetical protein